MAAVVIKRAKRKYKNAERVIDASSGTRSPLPASALTMEDNATTTPATPSKIHISDFNIYLLFIFTLATK
jgi:hypothetical protein